MNIPDRRDNPKTKNFKFRLIKNLASNGTNEAMSLYIFKFSLTFYRATVDGFKGMSGLLKVSTF